MKSMHRTVYGSLPVACTLVAPLKRGSFGKLLLAGGQLLSVAGICAMAAAPLQGQAPAPGYQATQELVAPGVLVDPFELGWDVAGKGATLSTGDLIEFDGLNLRRLDPLGNIVQTYLTLDLAVVPAFVILSADENVAVTGDSKWRIYRIELGTGDTTLVASIARPNDAAFISDNEIVVSALNTSMGFGDVSMDLIRLNIDSGATAPIANVSGNVGPVEFGAQGELFFGSQILDVNPVINELLSFTSADIQSGHLLGDGDSQLISTGWDRIDNLELDPLTNDLFLVENPLGGTPGIYRVRSSKTESELIAQAAAGLRIDKPQIFNGSGAATFESYQPSLGARMVYQAIEFVDQTVVERFTLVPRRASLNATSDLGMIHFNAENAAPNGTMILFYGSTALASSTEMSFALAEIPPLFWSLDLATQRFLPMPFVADEIGTVSKSFSNPGLLPGELSFQGLLINNTGNIVGTTSVSHL